MNTTHDCWDTVLSFIGPRYYLLIASIDKALSTAYVEKYNTETDGELWVQSESEQQCLLLLQWMRCNGYLCTDKTGANAARMGYFQVLQWLQNYNYCWNSFTCSMAAAARRLDVLIWLHSIDCEPDIYTLNNAAFVGDMEMVQWCLTKGVVWCSSTGENASEGGHLSMLKWAFANKLPIGDACTRAAKGGHVKILKWTHNNGDYIAKNTCRHAAALAGHLNILQWLEEIYGDLLWVDGDVCAYAAEGGQLEVLKWAINKGSKKHICSEAVHAGHLEVLKWAIINGCPLPPRMLYVARRKGHRYIEAWLISKFGNSLEN